MLPPRVDGTGHKVSFAIITSVAAAGKLSFKKLASFLSAMETDEETG